MEDIIYIRVLLIKEKLGKISLEEKAELDQYLEQSEAARELQKEIMSISREDFTDFTSNLDVENGLSRVLHHYTESKRKKRKLIIQIAGSMAAAALIGWGIFILTNNTNQHSFNSASIKAEKTNDNNSATLILANGDIINLNASGYQQVIAGKASLNNNNRVLKFTKEVNGLDEENKSWNTLTVPSKLDYQIELSDGTTVWLNSTTQLRFPFAFSAENREVFLDAGEAYFKVSPKSEKPFLVHTKMGDVQVLGTEFNVNAYTPNQLITSLVNGKVAIKAGIDRKELTPGSEAVVEAGKAISTQTFDPSITLSWRQGLHYFNDATITSVATMLERWFDTPLIIDNAQVANIAFRGRLYRTKPLQSFIDQMNLTGDVTFYWKDGKLHCK